MNQVDGHDGERSLIEEDGVEQPHVAFMIVVLATIVLSVFVAVMTAVDPASTLPLQSAAAIFPVATSPY